MIQIERINHEGLGVPPDIFDTFFVTVVSSFKDIIGADWTPEMETAWSRLLAELAH